MARWVSSSIKGKKPEIRWEVGSKKSLKYGIRTQSQSKIDAYPLRQQLNVMQRVKILDTENANILERP